ncbi:MAG: GNAT family N-acetyltransferase [Gemmatimonadetes bacterium]|nr:GNAT family N-acetyltransferase [Gemmatimonadota bacterium]
MVEGLSFRPASVEDADTIDGIATSAFGPSEHRLSEIRRYLTLEPNYWLLATIQGDPVGVVGATDYGSFAYLGMMTVRREFQRKGTGGALFRRELEWLEELGLHRLRLDATEDGFPVYSRAGFEVFDEAVMFELSEPLVFGDIPDDVRVLKEEDLGILAEFDRPVFGGDRKQLFCALLQDFPGRAFASHDTSGDMTGFLFVQHKRIGPWVAQSPDDAEALLRSALALPFRGSPVAVALGLNPSSGELLDRFGFKPGRGSRHMQRGIPSIPGDRTCIYGQTSFAVG